MAVVARCPIWRSKLEQVFVSSIGPGGFEPPLTDPKSAVLPLDEGPVKCLAGAGLKPSGQLAGAKGGLAFDDVDPETSIQLLTISAPLSGNLAAGLASAPDTVTSSTGPMTSGGPTTSKKTDALMEQALGRLLSPSNLVALSPELYRALGDQAPGFFWLVDTEGRFIYAN